MTKDYNCLKKNAVPPRMYTKNDVVKLYNNSGTAYFDRDKLNKLINSSFKINKDDKKTILKDELSRIFYKKTRHYFTQEECFLVFEYIGYPVLSHKNIQFLLNKGLIEYSQLDEHNILYK